MAEYKLRGDDLYVVDNGTETGLGIVDKGYGSVIAWLLNWGAHQPQLNSVLLELVQEPMYSAVEEAQTAVRELPRVVSGQAKVEGMILRAEGNLIVDYGNRPLMAALRPEAAKNLCEIMVRGQKYPTQHAVLKEYIQVAKTLLKLTGYRTLPVKEGGAGPNDQNEP